MARRHPARARPRAAGNGHGPARRQRPAPRRRQRHGPASAGNGHGPAPQPGYGACSSARYGPAPQHGGLPATAHAAARTVPLSGARRGRHGHPRRRAWPAPVVVTVADPTGRQEARTTTDRDGRYAVALRAAGTYLVVAAAGAYQPHAALVVVGPAPPPARRHALGHVRRARCRPARRGTGRGRGRHADRRAG